ncbi:MAG: type IV pilin [Cuniculiplasma sp.]
MKQVSVREDRSVSELIGTLLLIAITVILMTTLGLFLFQNSPKGNPQVPRMNIQLTRDELTYNNEYLLQVQSVTENIPISQIELDIVLHNYGKPVIISLSSKSVYNSYPVIMCLSDISLNGKNLPITLFNSSLSMRLFIPENMNFTYVSIIDKSTDSILTGSPVSGISSSINGMKLEPFISDEMQMTKNLTYGELNVSNPSGIMMNNQSVFNSLSNRNMTFEFNSTNSSFNPYSQSYLFQKGIKFPYEQLNEKTYTSNVYGFFAETYFNLSKSTTSLFLNLTTSEPSYVRIEQKGNASNTIVPFDNYTYQHKYNGNLTSFNSTFNLTAGNYEIKIYYFDNFSNGVMAMRLIL